MQLTFESEVGEGVEYEIKIDKMNMKPFRLKILNVFCTLAVCIYRMKLFLRILAVYTAPQ